MPADAVRTSSLCCLGTQKTLTDLELCGSYNFDKALPAFLKSVEINPRFGKGFEGVGAVYFGLGEEEKAVPYLTKAVNFMPDQVCCKSSQHTLCVCLK